MIGSLITRGLALIFGYAYPAYECYKTVEMNKPEIEQLRFWCQYWILVAVITVCERIGDTFIGWVPMYGEAKLAFFIYLWYPKTKGTSYVYDSFFKPYMAKHETEIDRNLLEFRTRAGDMLVLYWQKAASYGQSRIFEILQYIASQSTPPPPAQPQQQEANRLQTATTPSIARSDSAIQPQPSSPSSSNSSEEEADDDDDVDIIEEAEPSENSKAANLPKTTTSKEQEETSSKTALVLTTKASSSSEEEGFVQVDKVVTTEGQSAQDSDILMEDAVRVTTRARSRKARASASSVQ